MAFGAQLVRRPRGEVRALELLGLRFDAGPERRVELAHDRHPGALAVGDLVEILFHPGRELEVDELAEVADEQVRDDLADRLPDAAAAPGP